MNNNPENTLIIIKDRDGDFSAFAWRPVSEQVARTKIDMYNILERGNRTAEIVTDPLIRQICANIPVMDIFKNMDELVEEIGEIDRRIRGALSEINDVCAKMTKMKNNIGMEL